MTEINSNYQHWRQHQLHKLIAHLFGQKIFFKSMTKTLALLLTLTFITPYVTWAFDQAAYLQGPNRINLQHQFYNIPRQYGQVTDHFQGHGPTIIYIQDLHCQQEVQLNIAQLLAHLVQDNQIRLIGVEGASEALDVSKLRTFPLQKVKELVGRHFIRTGQMSGAEYYAATGKIPVILDGIETPQLYQHSRQAIEAFLTDETQGLIWDLRDALDTLKDSVYHETLKDYDKDVMAFKSGQWPLLKYSAFLYETAQAQGLPLAPYQEIKKTISKRRHVLPYGVDQDQLIKEVDDLDRAIRRTLYQNRQEEALDQRLRQVELMEKLLNVSATTAELEAFQANRASYTVASFLKFIHQVESNLMEKRPPQILEAGLLHLDEALDKVSGFYEQADQRSEAFVTNLLASMRAQGQEQAVLLSGGYHQAGILESLKQKDVSYISIKPRLTQVDLINPYFALLRHEKTSLEKLLAQNQTLIALASRFKPLSMASLPDKELPDALRFFAEQLDVVAKATTVELKMDAADVNPQELQVYVQQQLASYAENDPAIDFDWSAVRSNEKTKTYLVPIENTDITALFSPRRIWHLGTGLTNMKVRFLSNQEAKQRARAILSTPAWYSWSQSISQAWHKIRTSLIALFHQLQSLRRTHSGWAENWRLSSWLQARFASPGQWPFLQKWLYKNLEKRILGPKGKNASPWRHRIAWFMADVFAPAVVESVGFVGLTTWWHLQLLNQPLLFGMSFWVFFLVYKFFWHILHLVGIEGTLSPIQQLKLAFFNLSYLSLTGFQVVLFALVGTALNPSGMTFIAYYLGGLLVAHVFVEARPRLVKFWGQQVDLWHQFSVSDRTWELENVIASLGFWISRIAFPREIRRQIKWGQWGLFLDIGGIIVFTLLTGLFFPKAGLLAMSLPLLLYTALLQGFKTIDLIVHGEQAFRWFHVLQFIIGFLKQLLMLLPYLPVLVLYHDDILMLHVHVPLVSIVFWVVNVLYFRELYEALAYKVIDLKKELAYDNPSWTQVKKALAMVRESNRKKILDRMEAISLKYRLTLGDIDAEQVNQLSGRAYNQYWPDSVNRKAVEAAAELGALVREANEKYLKKMPNELRPYFWTGMLYNQIFRYAYNFNPENTHSNFESFLHCHYVSEYAAHAAEEYGVANGVEHGWYQPFIEKLRQAAWLHDYGKVFIDPAILYDTGRFDPQQRMLVMAHSRVGEIVLKSFGLDPVMVEGTIHHEELNGNGYPYGLTSVETTAIQEALPVVDKYEAVTSFHRTYRLDRKLFYQMRDELLKLAGKGILDMKWVKAMVRATKIYPKKPDVSPFIKPDGYTGFNPQEEALHAMISEILLYGAHGQRYFPLYRATMEELTTADEMPANEDWGGLPLLDTSAGDLALVNGMMTIAGNYQRMSKDILRDAAHVMLGIIKKEGQYTQQVTYAAFFTLQTIKNKLSQKLKWQINKIAGDRNKYNLFDLVNRDHHLARIRQYLTQEGELPARILLPKNENDVGININIIGWSPVEAAKIAADASQLNPRHHVIVSETHMPEFVITDQRSSLDPKNYRIAYFKGNKIVGIYYLGGRVDTSVRSYRRFNSWFKDYKKDESSLPRGISAESTNYDNEALRLGLGLKHNPFGINVKSKIKICLNLLGTYPGLEEKILTQMANDNSLREGGLIITGNPLIPISYQQSDCQFTVYQKKNGELKPLKIFLIKGDKRYEFSVEGKTIMEAERLGHAVITVMQNDADFEQPCRELGIDHIEVKTDIPPLEEVDLGKWETNVAGSREQHAFLQSTSPLKGAKAAENEDQNDQKDGGNNDPPPAAPGTSGEANGGTGSTIPSEPSQKFSMVEEANQPYYTRLSVGQRMLRWLLGQFVFTADQEKSITRSGLGMIFGAPLKALRLLVNILINRPLKSGVMIDDHHPALIRLLRQNHLPDPVSLQAAVRQARSMPDMAIKPLSQLREKRARDWKGRLVLAGEEVGDQLFTQTVLFLPDSLLREVVRQPEGSSWWQKSRKAVTEALLGASLTQLRQENEQRWEVDLLMEGVTHTAWQAPITLFETFFKTINHLPRSWQAPVMRLLRLWNAPAYINMVLKGQASPLASALTQPNQPLAQTYKLWAVTGNIQMRARFEKLLQQFWQSQAVNLSDENRINNLMSLSSLARAIPELGSVHVGDLTTKDGLKDIYLPSFMLDSNMMKGRVLDELRPLLQIINQEAFEKFAPSRQNRSLRNAA